MLEHVENPRVKPRAAGEGRRKLASADELAVLEVLGGGVILWEAARHALEPLALEPPEATPERGRLDDRAQPLAVRRHVLADRLELRGVGRVQSPAGPHPLRRDLEIEAGAAMSLHAAPREHGRNLGLQRRLICGKPRVPVDAERRHLRRGDQLGCERFEVLAEPFDDLHERGADDELVAILARLEPLAIVIALQRAQERQRRCRETRGPAIGPLRLARPHGALARRTRLSLRSEKRAPPGAPLAVLFDPRPRFLQRASCAAVSQLLAGGP